MGEPKPKSVIWEDDERTLTREQVEKALDDLSSFQGNVRHVIECYRDALAEALEVMALDRDELVRMDRSVNRLSED